MPHLMCRTCRVRVHRPLEASPEELVCACGAPFDPVEDLSRLIGFRAEDGTGDRQASRSAARALARRHADGSESWGTLRTEAMRLPVPERPS